MVVIKKWMGVNIDDIEKIMGINKANLSKFMDLDLSLGYEDFTTYTEVDEDSDITVTENSIDCVTMRRDAVSYVRKDFGVDYFENFEVQFDFYLGASTGSAFVSVFALSNGANTFQEKLDGNDGLAVSYQDVQFPQNRIYATKFEAPVTQYYYDTNFLLWRYITAYRTGNQFYVKIYSDSDRNILLDTLQVTCGTTKYRYCYGLSSRDSSTLPADVISTTVANFKIVSHN